MTDPVQKDGPRLVSSEGRNLWDRMKGAHGRMEPPKAFAAFQTFVKLGAGRTVKETARQLGKRSTRRMYQWRTKWRWDARAEAWDRHLQSEYETHAVDQVKALKENHLDIVRGMAEIVDRETAAHIRRVRQADKNDPKRDTPLLSASELKNMAKNAIELGRLVMGETTEHTEVSDGPDYSKLSVEELRQLRYLRDKAKENT